MTSDSAVTSVAGRVALEAITRDDVAHYRDDLKAEGRKLRKMPEGEQPREGRLSNRVIVRHLVVLHGIFRRARQVWPGLPANPASAELVDRPPVRYSGDFKTLTPSEVRLLAQHAKTEQDAALYLTAAFTGLRQGELFALRWRDVDFVNSRLNVRANWSNKQLKTPKSKKVRSAPMVDEVMSALDSLSRRGYETEPSDLVFPSATGGHLDDMAVRRAFYRALEAAQLPRVRFHDLRHAFATLAVQVWDLSRVQGYCGHEHITTTMRYVHHTPAVEDANLLSAKLAADSDAVFGTYSGPILRVADEAADENPAFVGSS